jgi:AbrB family looped-hinge helix DNA binding protein
MTVTMSAKGQIVVPKEIRQRAGIDVGDKLEIHLKEGEILLKKTGKTQLRKIRVKIDKETGFPCFDTPKGLPPMTDEWVKEQLANFP